jgi:glycosyltransferase involved in cell wall biosynthesis
MKDLFITSNNSVSVALSWISDGADAIILGIDDEFQFEEIATTSASSYIVKKPTKYVGFKVLLTVDDTVVDSTSPVLLPKDDNELVLIPLFLKSFRGFTMSIITPVLFNFYRIYDVTEDATDLIMETEDFVVNTDKFVEGHKYYIEGYNRTKDGEQLMSSSPIVECKSMDFIHKGRTIDVICPVWNTGMRLLHCVDSLIMSSFEALHIILVDDGSTSEVTKNILDYYEKNYDYIEVIHTENKEKCHARNTGIKAAKAEWVALIDHDDYVHCHMYSLLYAGAQRNKTDIALAQTVIRENPGEMTIYNSWDKQPPEVIYTQSQLWNNRGSVNNIYFVAVWNKIVKRKIALKTAFPEIEDYRSFIMYEDDAWTPSLYSYIDRFLLINGAYYCWDKRKQKTTGTASNMHEGDDALDIWKAYMDANSWGIKHHGKKYTVQITYSINTYIKTNHVNLYTFHNKVMEHLAKG